jgi:methionyl aminopeptidase
MINIKSPGEIEKMRVSCEITASLMAAVGEMIEPGVETGELDAAAARFIRDRGARPAFKGYRGYPATLCVSVNEEVVHGIPGRRELRAGDLVSIDAGVEHGGYFGDMARTFAVGAVDSEKARLAEAARLAVVDAVRQAVAGGWLFDLSHAIESRAEAGGFSVVRDYVGHGIGVRLHEDPQIPNYGKPRTGPRLKPGMTFAVEAMINAGSHAVRVLSDGWTVVTRDRRPSAHYEDTIAITENGPEVLTCQKGKKP